MRKNKSVEISGAPHNQVSKNFDSRVCSVAHTLDACNIFLIFSSSDKAKAIPQNLLKDTCMHHLNSIANVAAGMLRLQYMPKKHEQKSLVGFGGGDHRGDLLKKLDVYIGLGLFGGAAGLLLFASTSIPHLAAYMTGAFLGVTIAWATTENLKNI